MPRVQGAQCRQESDFPPSGPQRRRRVAHGCDGFDLLHGVNWLEYPYLVPFIKHLASPKLVRA
jgi:hypothetical protein